MKYSPLAIRRIHVLGEIYSQCDQIDSIPVYLHEKNGEALGHADESMGKYADAFLFHLPELICKALSQGHYNYAFDFEYSAGSESQPARKRRITLNSIVLVPNRRVEEKAKV